MGTIPIRRGIRQVRTPTREEMRVMVIQGVTFKTNLPDDEVKRLFTETFESILALR